MNNISGLTQNKNGAKLTEGLFFLAEEMFEIRYNTTE